MTNSTLACLLADLTAYNVGLLGLHVEYRYWLEELDRLASLPSANWWSQTTIRTRQIEDILERVEMAIRHLEKEIQ